MKFKQLAPISILLFFFIDTVSAQQSFGLKAGVQFSKMEEFVLSTSPLTSFQIKATSIFKINKSISLTPSLGYSGKGYVFRSLVIMDELGNEVGLGDANSLFNFVQLSVPLSYTIALKKENAIYVGAGPYFAYALSGKGKFKRSNVSMDSDSWDLFATDVYKRTDAGLVIEMEGVLKKRFLVALNVDFGLTDISKLEGYKIKSKAAGISVGYLFTGH